MKKLQAELRILLSLKLLVGDLHILCRGGTSEVVTMTKTEGVVGCGCPIDNVPLHTKI